ncbi:molybdopterin-binding protein [Vibrio lentus]|nr:molybdopterin-binding protein [Vibrio lentus]
MITGGNGFHICDSTPEALKPLFDKEVEGFGVSFSHKYLTKRRHARQFNLVRIAGFANHTVIFAMPGLYRCVSQVGLHHQATDGC